MARIVECLKNGNLKGSPAKDGSSRKPLKIVAEQRGFDHGVFIPMMLAWCVLVNYLSCVADSRCKFLMNLQSIVSVGRMPTFPWCPCQSK